MKADSNLSDETKIIMFREYANKVQLERKEPKKLTPLVVFQVIEKLPSGYFNRFSDSQRMKFIATELNAYMH
jgi:hypothetical protein